MAFSELQCPCMQNGDGHLLLPEDVPRWAHVYGGLTSCMLGMAEVRYLLAVIATGRLCSDYRI